MTAKLVLPAGILVVFLLVGPLVQLMRISLNEYDPLLLMQAALTGENYFRAIADPYYRSVMLTTLTMAIGCTFLALLLGLPPAYWIARMSSKLKSVVVIATLIPLLVGNIVRVAGWMGLLGTEGAVNVGLQGIGWTEAPLQLLYTPAAVVIGTVAVVLPYMILTLASIIEGIPRALEEAAANLGASTSTVFRRILFPLALPGVTAGCTLVFIMCMNTFATAVLLGGPQFKMMAPAVYDQFARGMNWPFGAALSIILLGTTLILSTVGNVLLNRQSGRPRTR